MRTCGALLLLLGGVAAWAMHFDSATGLAQPDSLEWIRSANGWVPVSALHERPPQTPPLNPLVVAGVQLLGSLLVLIGFERTHRG